MNHQRELSIDFDEVTEPSLRRLGNLAPPQRQMWIDRGEQAVLTIYGDGTILPSTRYGPRAVGRADKLDLTELPDVARVVRRFLEVRPTGGRLFFGRHFVWCYDADSRPTIIAIVRSPALVGGS